MRIKLGVAVLLAAGMMAVVQAQPGGGRFGGFGGPVALVTNKAVQEEVKMTDEQVTKVKEWAKEFGDTTRKTMTEKMKDVPKDEQGEKRTALLAEINKDAYKQLGDVLKKEQVARIKQIDRQQMGVNAFSDPDVVAALKLTDSQKTTVKGITGDFSKERREIMAEVGGKGKFDFEKFQDAQKKISKVQKEYVGKVADVLTDEQKKTWKGLTGEPFDLTKLAPMPPKKKD